MALALFVFRKNNPRNFEYFLTISPGLLLRTISLLCQHSVHPLCSAFNLNIVSKQAFPRHAESYVYNVQA